MAGAADVTFGGALGFLIGVFAASAGLSIFFALGIALTAAVFFLFVRRFEKIFAALFILSLFFGFFYYHLYGNAAEAREKIVFDRAFTFSGIVVSEPRITEKTQQFLIKLEAPLNGKVKAVTRHVPEFHYGDLLEVNGTIIREENMYSPNTEAVVLFPEIELKEAHRGFSLKEKLVTFKNAAIGEFRRVLPSDSAALLSGLTFGSRSDFSPALKNAMALSGTTHLVALSGYNISILVLAIAGFFQYFLGRRSTFYLTVLAILLFVVMVGGEASVVRAALMGFLALLAKEVGRRYSVRNAVTLAAAGMTLFDPTILVWNIGFQLSFLAFLGIIYLEPALKELMQKISSQKEEMRAKRRKSFLGWKENALTTLSAQLAVAPLIITQFNEISLTSLFANIFILEFVPFTMALGFFLALAGLAIPSFGFLIGWLVNILLTYEIGVIELFSRVRIPVGGAGSWVLFAFYYAVLVWGIIYFKEKPRDAHAR